MRSFQSFSEIIEAFGGTVQFGEAIGVTDSHARTMLARNSIAASRWKAVADAAAARALEGVTLEAMATIEAGKHQAAEQREAV